MQIHCVACGNRYIGDATSFRFHRNSCCLLSPFYAITNRGSNICYRAVLSYAITQHGTITYVTSCQLWRRMGLTNSNCADETRRSERFSEVQSFRCRQHKTFNYKEADFTCLLRHFSTFINTTSESAQSLKLRWTFL